MKSPALALGTRKGLLIWRSGPAGWRLAEEHFVGAIVPYASQDPRSGYLYATIDHGHFGGKFHRSQDGGKTWTELPAPQYPQGAVIKDDKPAVLKYQWCLATGGLDEPGRIYNGTEPGGLFVSDSHGEGFQINEGLWNHPSRLASDLGWMGGGRDNAGIHSVLVDPRDSRTIRVGISVAGVFTTNDGGRSWRPTNRGLRAEYLPDPNVEVGHDPHLVVQCRKEPDILWQQNHMGIYRSTDGGENWVDVSQPQTGAKFGFAIAVDPNRGNVAWVLPAESDMARVAWERRLQVCRSDDGGRSWQSFSKGLPQHDCYDFAFRHSLDLATTNGDGEISLLAFGTAGGSLYVSDDRGESWRSLASHLPPVYSVRFVNA